MDEAKALADDARVAEDTLDPRRLSVGYDVEILRPTAEKEITHRTAYEIGLMSVFPEALDDADGLWVEARGIDAMFRLSVHESLRHWLPVLGSSIADEQN